jgi:PST family polysaccharide transporter
MLKLINWRGRSVWGALFILIRTIGAMAVQKLIAVLYGPTGTTLFSHFQNFISLFTQPVQDVVAQGLLNAYPNLEFSRKKLYATAVITLLLVFIATSSILWVTDSFPAHIFKFSLYQWSLIIVAILILCFQSIASAILIAQQKLKLLSFIQLSQWLILVLFLSYFNESLINTLFYYIAILAVFTLVFYGFISEELKYFQLFKYSIDKKITHHFKQFLMMGLAVWISSKWVDFFIREYAINLFGAKETGLWQAVVRISEAYRGLFISFLMITFYPAISKLLATDKIRLKVFVKKQLKLYLILTLLFLSIVYLMHPYIIKILYSSDYLAASPLFKLQILGDIVAFISFPMALVLMATVKTKGYVICELLSAGAYVASIYWGHGIGIEILVLAHIIRFLLYLVVVLFFMRNALKFE